VVVGVLVVVVVVVGTVVLRYGCTGVGWFWWWVLLGGRGSGDSVQLYYPVNPVVAGVVS